jgi:uncharacterized protein involved in exopolysaccharide biosynthesis
MQQEITLKELLISIQEWFSFLLSKWVFILILGLAGGAIGLGVSFFSKPKYLAKSTFVIEEKSNGNNLGAYAGIAAQFGINLGGGDNTLFAGENIMEFMKSRLMIEKTLLSPVVVDGKEDLLLNLFIQSEGMAKSWAKNPHTNVHFEINQPRETFSLVQDSLLKEVYNYIIKKNIAVAKPDKRLSIIALEVNSKSEQFSLNFNRILLAHVSDFYVKTKTKKLKENVDILQSKTDSVKEDLDNAIVRRANFGDQNLNLVSQTAQITRLRAERDVQVLSTMYTELIKNLELAKFSLAKEEPLIQLIDGPQLPLEKKKFGKAKGLVLGGLFAGIMAGFILIALRVYQNIIASE